MIRLKALSLENTGVISTQVLQEFFVVSTKKLGVEPLSAKEIMLSFNRFEIVVITPQLISEAIDCSIINQLSFRDSLIVVAAENASCRSILTEDLNHGQMIRGIQVENPCL